MKNIRRKLSAVVLMAAFASMQAGYAFDIGLGRGNGGADFQGATGGFKELNTDGTNATLEFTGNSHVQWNTLNVNSGETLNFNAVNGATGLTVLNTVNRGMSTFAGNVNANSGIAKLIISNPNGVLFDGAKFTTAGDAMITTQPMTATFTNGVMNIVNQPTTNEVGMVQIQNSTFTTGGELNILAPSVDVVGGHINASNGVKFVTANGQDYLATGNVLNAGDSAVRLEAVNIDGNVYIVSGKGVVKTVTGGDIKGNVKIESDGNVALNYVDNGKVLTVKGDVDVTGNGVLMYARNTKVDGNLNMENGGGFLEVGNVQVGKDMNLTTTAKSENGYKHFTHVIGETKVGGNVNIESKDNIHIGNYKMGTKVVQSGCCGEKVVNDYATSELLPGHLTVGGNLTAHAQDGHVMTTIDVNANKIDLKSDNLNVLTSENAVLTANEYKFNSNGYIGAIKDYTKADGTTLTATEQIVGLMEEYIYIPNDIASHAYTQIAGGNVTQIKTSGNAYIASRGDVTVTGADAKDVNITAYRSKVTITGPDVHAKNINVGEETDYLKLDFSGRDFTTNYTNIRDEKVTTIRPDEEITYQLTDGANGYNQPTLQPAEKTTYLIGPAPVNPQPEEPSVNDNNENARNLMTQWAPDDIMQSPVNTPVAFAADLDEDENGTPVRKNVDGSVTVVRAFAVGK